MFSAEPEVAVNTITVQDLHSAADVPVVDVREADEFAAGHVPGAVNLPLSTLGSRLDELPDGSFAVICQVGVRSGRAVQALSARGYAATNVDGGTSEWVAAGYPLES